MKKIMAMVLSVVMLLTLAVAMPVSAAIEDVNLVVNGDFEIVGTTETDIPGWTQEGQYGNKNFKQDTAVYNNTAKIVDLPSKAAVYTVDHNETWANGNLTQTITIDENSDYYVHYYAYDYMLSMDIFQATGVYRGTPMLEVTGANGTKAEVTPALTVNGNNNVNAHTFNVSELVADTIGDQPIKTIKIKLYCKHNNYGIAFDNIKLTPELNGNELPEGFKPTVNLIWNGSFEKVINGELANWTPINADIEYQVITTGATEGLNRIYYKNLADNAYPGVKQEIVIDKEADWYTNQGKYRYMLSFDGLVGGRAPSGIVEVTVTDADGFENSAVYAGGTNYGVDLPEEKYWKVIGFELDLSNIIDSAESKVEKLEITLRNNPYINGEMSWDNVKLVPVYDEDKVVPEKELNLIKNGEFKYLGATATEIPGWTQEGEFGNKYFKQSTELWNGVDGIDDGAWKYDDMPTMSAVYTVCLAETWAVGRLTQTAVIDTAADYYVNYNKYDYELSMDVYQSGSAYRGWAELTVTGADGTVATISSLPFVTNSTEYSINNQTFRIKELVADTIGDQPIKSIKVGLCGNHNGHSIAYDNVKLVPVKVVDLAIVDGDGAEVNEIATAENATFTAKASYSGSDAAAYSYIAVYAKDANGVIRLMGANAAPLTAGVENTSATLQNINTTAGVTIVKAFIWGSDAVSVIGVTAE